MESVKTITTDLFANMIWVIAVWLLETLLLTVAIANVKKKTSLMIMMAFYIHISQSADKLK